MTINSLKGKLVAVLGYGMEGKAVTAYLLKNGISPALFDNKPWEKWPKAEQEEIKTLGLNFIFGPDCFKELAGFNVVFRSPGIKISDISNQISAQTIITSQTKWFFDHCPSKIIGVTGTKGKGTTSTLIYKILKRGSKVQIPNSQSNQNFQNTNPHIYLTGNIGNIQPFEILDNLKPDDYIIYELSSFQLQDLHTSPHIAVVLMTTSEHLDYHKNLAEYVEAKSAITKFQNPDDFAIINADFPSSVSIGKQGQGQKLFFSRKKDLETGVFFKDDKIVVKNVLGQNLQLTTYNLQLKGQHNLENICASALVANCLNIDNATIIHVINNFKGLEHRLEFVAEKHGIKFYNDSFSTTPETAIAGISSFTEPLIVILGGSRKNSDFSELGKVINESKTIKAVILVGQEAKKIKDAVLSVVFPPFLKGGQEGLKIFEQAKTMKEIFEQINSVAESGDVVLLSPACASFDMFKNYKDRGEQFKEWVNLW